jgi:predicted ATPase/DNA-binding SARP family transcriptional activator
MSSSSAALKVVTLGQFSLLRNQEVVGGGNWKHRRVRELLKVLLAAEQHRLHREQVQEILWPSSSLEQAANSFGKTLYLLRRALEPELAIGKASAYVGLDHDTLFLIPDSMQVDADLFEAAAKQLQTRMQGQAGTGHDLATLLEAIDQALALYGGDFLPDDLYEDWSQRRRDRLRHTYARVLQHGVTVSLAAAQGQRACEYLRALVEQNSTDEQTHRQLMLVYARMGHRSDALNQYHTLRAALREELHANPMPETQELYRTIQAGRIAVDLAEAGHADHAVGLSNSAPAHEPVSAPLLHTHAHAITDEHLHDMHPEHTHAGTSIATAAPAAPTEAEYVEPPSALRVELIGRAEELQRLRMAYRALYQGKAQAATRALQQRERGREVLAHVFFISGEAGIGKTRLAQEFSLYAQQQAATVLWGNCYEMTGTLPYQPIVDMLNAHLLPRSAEQLRSLLGESAADLAKLLPLVRTKLPDLPPSETLGLEAERRNLYIAVARYFTTMASAEPLALIFDDLQWADTATIQLLGYLLAQSSNATGQGQRTPLFLLLYRPDEVGETHPLRSLLLTRMHEGQAQELRLKRLKEDEVQQLLMQMAGHTVSTPFADEIYKHTEGNPFFIGETIRALVEDGKIKRIGERWQTTVALTDLALPQSVRRVIERRLANLPGECRVTLAYAALLGRQIRSELLCRTRNLSEEIIAEQLDEAIRVHILEPLSARPQASEQEYAIDEAADLMFTHDKIREVLARSLNPLRHRMAHRQIAQAIEAFYSSRLSRHYRKLAYHYQLAEEAARAVEYLNKAAEQAIQLYAFADAAALMEQALELLTGEEQRPQRAELLHKLSANVYLYMGRPDQAIEAGLAAATLFQELGDNVKEAENRLDVAFSFHWMGRETNAIACIKRALTCLEQVQQTERERHLIAKARVQWGLAATISGDIPEALAQLRIADAWLEQNKASDPFVAVVSLWAHSWCAFASSTLAEMLDAAQQSAALCRSTGMFAWEPMMTYTAAWALMSMGRLPEAAQLARETLAKAQRHNVVGAQGWAYLVLSFVAIQQGQWDLSAQFGDQAAEIATRMHETGLLARVFWGRSICAGWLNQWEKSADDGFEAVRISRSDGEFPLIYPYLLMQAGKASYYAGNHARAREALDSAMRFAQEHQYRQLPAICQRVQGRILQAQGQFEQAQQQFEQSLTTLAALDDSVEYARTQEAYALFFRARGQAHDAELADTLQQQAHATFKALGVNG